MNSRTIILSFFLCLATIVGLSLYTLSIDENTLSLAQTKPTHEQKQRMDGSIIYVSDRTGNYDIFRMDLRTRKTTNLTRHAAHDMNPQISPDGNSLVFYSYRDGDAEIYLMRLADRQVTQLTNNIHSDYDPSFSPDGSMIVFKSNRDDDLGDIFTMRSDGTQQKNITPTMSTTEEWDPTYSPDGQRIYFVVRQDSDDTTDELYRINADGTTLQQLTFNTVADWYVSTHPVTEKLLFVSKQLPNQQEDIYTSNPDGTDKRRLLQLNGNDADPAWSTDGEKIIFINDNDGDYDLYIMQQDGTNPIKIIDTNDTELSPIFLR